MGRLSWIREVGPKSESEEDLTVEEEKRMW